MLRYEVSADAIVRCEQVGILAQIEIGDRSYYSANSYLRMEIYIRSRALGIGISECKTLIDEAEADIRAKLIAYARQRGVSATRRKRSS